MMEQYKLDKETLANVWNNLFDGDETKKAEASAIICDALADYTSIVRCKDCKYCSHHYLRMASEETEYNLCSYHDCEVLEKDFCSKGEKK